MHINWEKPNLTQSSSSRQPDTYALGSTVLSHSEPHSNKIM